MNTENNGFPTEAELDACGQQTPTFLESDNWFVCDVAPYRLDFTKPYTPPDYTLAWNGIGFAPLGGIHAITGQAGHGKTMIIAQFMAAILKGEFGALTYNLKATIPHPRVLYIDTEMEEPNTIAVKNRVLSICDRDISKNYDDFIVVMLREVPETVERVSVEHGRMQNVKVSSTINRWRMTLKAIYDYKPTVAFIDGLLDVATDFNDNKECQEVIYKCMQVASHYGISLWCVVHQNPGGEKLVGHLGSFLERKATDIFTTKKDKKANDVMFTVEQKKARGRDIPDWKFRVLTVGSWGMPEQVNGVESQCDSPEKIQQWIKSAKSEFSKPLSKNAIKELFKKIGGTTHTTTLEADIEVAINRRFFVLAEKQKGWTHPKYELNKVIFPDVSPENEYN